MLHQPQVCYFNKVKTNETNETNHTHSMCSIVRTHTKSPSSHIVTSPSVPPHARYLHSRRWTAQQGSTLSGFGALYVSMHVCTDGWHTRQPCSRVEPIYLSGITIACWRIRKLTKISHNPFETKAGAKNNTLPSLVVHDASSHKSRRSFDRH